jgi:hypothetical protein
MPKDYVSFPWSVFAAPHMSQFGTYRTSRHVRPSVAIRGITDIAPAAHFGSV